MNRRTTLILGIFSYLALALLAIYFYQERTMFSDVAYILFKLLQEGDWAIQVNRFVSFFTQSFGLFASKLGLPLKQVCVIHSAGFIVYYFAIFLIIFKWVKNEKMALGLLLFNTLMVAHSFYWTPSELIQGMAFVFLYFALLQKALEQDKVPIYVYIIGILTLITASFAHPLLNIALVFGLCFMGLSHPNKIKFLGINFLLVIALFVIKAKVIPNPYDSKAMGGLNNLITLFPNYWTHSFQNFFGYLIKDYYFLTLLLFAVSGFYAQQKRFLKLFLVLSFFAGYAFLVNVSLPKVNNQFYIESQYLVLAFFVIIPFVLDLLPKIKNTRIPIAMVSFIVLISLFRIYNSHNVYTERINWNRNFLAQTADLENPKLIVHRDKVPKETLLMTWGSSYEFWLLSTIEQGSTRSIIIVDKEDKFDWAMHRKKFFLTRWDFPHYNQLNPKYFILNDTLRSYEKY